MPQWKSKNKKRSTSDHNNLPPERCPPKETAMPKFWYNQWAIRHYFGCAPLDIRNAIMTLVIALFWWDSKPPTCWLSLGLFNLVEQPNYYIIIWNLHIVQLHGLQIRKFKIKSQFFLLIFRNLKPYKKSAVIQKNINSEKQQNYTECRKMRIIQPDDKAV